MATDHELISEREVKQASEALIQWFHSQGISPADALIVLVKTLSTALLTLCGRDKGGIARGMEVITAELEDYLEGRQ